jgi:lipid-A-disaccharide synthase
LKYYIIAGEASGDMHAANLMHEIKLLDIDADFRCWGGDRMLAEGGNVIKHIRELAFMGFVEVLLNIRTISKNLNFCKKDLIAYQPDALILVDYPGFNLRIAEYAKSKGLKVFYYISPSVWAWKESRVEIIKKSVDKLFAILPFEKDFYKKHQCDIDYEGHPLIDEIEKVKLKIPTREKFIIDNQLSGKKIIACLPGSRKQEIKLLLPEMIKQQKYYPEYEFVVAAAPNLPIEFYNSILGNQQVKMLSGKTYDLLFHSHAGIIKSGTSTLEAALFGLPEVCCYKGNPISIWIAKKVAKVKYISLPNLIMDKSMIKELIQDEMNEENLKNELTQIAGKTTQREKMIHDFEELKNVLGGSGASKRIAQKLIDYLKTN